MYFILTPKKTLIVIATQGNSHLLQPKKTATINNQFNSSTETVFF